MIPEEEALGLLAEADAAEQLGNFVLLTPEYTRHIVKLLRGEDLLFRNHLPTGETMPFKDLPIGTVFRRKEIQEDDIESRKLRLKVTDTEVVTFIPETYSPETETLVVDPKYITWSKCKDGNDSNPSVEEQQ